jgi:hypothetical protein
MHPQMLFRNQFYAGFMVLTNQITVLGMSSTEEVSKEADRGDHFTCVQIMLMCVGIDFGTVIVGCMGGNRKARVVGRHY